MTQNPPRIMILEDDGFFRNILENACAGLGQTTSVGDVDSAIKLITQETFRLLLLDWHLIHPQAASFYSTVDNYQLEANRLAIFTAPDLPNVITAMKSGFTDVLWAGQNEQTLRGKLIESIEQVPPANIPHSFVSHLADTMTETALVQKTSLFKARRNFSRTFLQQILNMQKLRRTQLASFMSVSPRTLHRHLAE